MFEDTSVGPLFCAQAGVSAEVIQGVEALTKLKGELYYDYIEKVLSNFYSTLVKREDTMCNLTKSQHEGNTKRVLKYAKQLGLLY